MNIKAIIFDCFGVVVTYGFHAAFTALGGDIEKDKDMLRDLFGMYNNGKVNDDEFLQKLSDRLDISKSTVQQALAKDEHINQELLDYIKQLKATYKIGLLSNIGRGGAERYFQGINTAEYFDDMVLSGEVGLVKPAAEIYLLAAKNLSAEPSECVFIDDGEHNCAGARAVGMQAIIYRNFAQMKQELAQILSKT